MLRRSAHIAVSRKASSISSKYWLFECRFRRRWNVSLIARNTSPTSRCGEFGVGNCLTVPGARFLCRVGAPQVNARRTYLATKTTLTT